jgi:UDP-N-acetyl-D-glucosamine dehydrogenase
VAVVPPTREHAIYRDRRSVALSAETLAGYDAVVLVTDHDAIDYDLVAASVPLVIDTRNAFGRRNIVAAHVVKA